MNRPLPTSPSKIMTAMTENTIFITETLADLTENEYKSVCAKIPASLRTVLSRGGNAKHPLLREAHKEGVAIYLR